MKKTLVALTILGAAGLAHAQSSMTIYGVADVGYVKDIVFSGDSKSVSMGSKVDSRLGFMGQEDLGGGLKATFQLEQRFNLANGQSSDLGDFEGAANVGLKGNFGHFRFGRVNQIVTETIRTFDPFNEYGVGAHVRNEVAGGHVALPFFGSNERQSNTARYDSPNMNGFVVSLAYQVSAENDPPTSNNGYSGLVKYSNGPLDLAFGYDKRANSGKSHYWSAAAAYSLGPVRLSAIYEKAVSKTDWVGFTYDGTEKNFLLGIAYKIGSGTINASFQNMDMSEGPLGGTDKKYALGYTYDLSKRTSVYADIAKWDYNKSYSWHYWGRSSNAANVGITHKF